MSAKHFEDIEKTLLYVSEARERAERAARALAAGEAQPHLVDALTRADDELLAVHRRLMERAYFTASGERQLALADQAAGSSAERGAP